MAKTRSKQQGLHYAAYKAQNKQAANRKRKLLKLQKEQPNNEQIQSALQTIKYRRYTPKVQHWSHTAIADAMLFKTFKKGSQVDIPKVSDKQMFSLKERAHYQGEKIWNS